MFFECTEPGPRAMMVQLLKSADIQVQVLESVPGLKIGTGASSLLSFPFSTFFCSSYISCS